MTSNIPNSASVRFWHVYSNHHTIVHLLLVNATKRSSFVDSNTHTHLCFLIIRISPVATRDFGNKWNKAFGIVSLFFYVVYCGIMFMFCLAEIVYINSLHRQTHTNISGKGKKHRGWILKFVDMRIGFAAIVYELRYKKWMPVIYFIKHK